MNPIIDAAKQDWITSITEQVVENKESRLPDDKKGFLSFDYDETRKFVEKAADQIEEIGGSPSKLWMAAIWTLSTEDLDDIITGITNAIEDERILNSIISKL
jgi:hypothetical protein